MKVLLIGQVGEMGGSQNAFRKLIDFLENEKYNLRVITISDGKDMHPFFKTNTIIGTIPHTKNNISGFFFKIYKLLYTSYKARKSNPDICISVGLSNSANFISYFLPRTCFTISQDFIADRVFGDKLLLRSINHMNGIVVQSPSMLENLPKQQFPHKFNWLPCFSESPIRNIIHTNKVFKSNNEIVKLAYFGRLAVNKGLYLLLNSIANQGINSEITLDIWGAGDEEEKLKEVALRLEISNKVKFNGRYPAGIEGAILFVSYDALVLTSTHSEGLPLVLIEAMSYGLPFLTTNIGAIKDCCINNPDSILVEPNQESINYGLSILINKIRKGDFDSNRLRSYYDNNYSEKIMGDMWRKFLGNPKNFFNV